MFRKFALFRNKQLREIFLGVDHVNLSRVVLLVSCNTAAALLEGISFAMIMLALTAFGDAKALAQIPIISRIPFLFSLSRQSFFIFFVISAIGCQVLRSSLAYIGQLKTVNLTLKIQVDLQKRIFRQILRLTFPCVSQYKAGDLVDYVNTPIHSINRIMDAFNRFLMSGLTIFVLAFFMFKVSASFTLAVLFLFVFFGLMQHILIKKISNASKRLMNNSIDFNKIIVQSLYGLRVIHLFNRQKDITEKVCALIDRISLSTKKLFTWSHSVTPVNEIIGIALVGSCLLVGPFFLHVKEGYLIPYLLSFLTITYRLSTRMQAFMSSLGDLAYNAGALLRIRAILDNKDKEFISEKGIDFEGLQKAIEFKDLSLHYQSSLPAAVKQFNSIFYRGAFIALVGHSGAGKSSLIDLVLRLYEPSTGKILVDGIPLEKYSLTSWRSKIGVVSQDTFIFNETIEENIRFGCEQVEMESLIEVAKMAGVHEFVSHLPEGYQTVVGERGYRLSGGERQRISLARALLRKPEILILDEATSNLDSHSEHRIQQAIEDLHHKITIIAIAHRLSTIVRADSILVLQNGVLIEQGTHKDLMNAEGYYASLWHIQSPRQKEMAV